MTNLREPVPIPSAPSTSTTIATRWKPLIPGTQVSRVEFLRLLVQAHEDPLSKNVFMSQYVREIGRWGVLNPAQIGRVIGCTSPSVRRHLKIQDMEPVVCRGTLDPKALDAMLALVLRRSRGYPADPVLVEELADSDKVSPAMLEKLCGVDPKTYKIARARRALRLVSA